MIGIEPAVAAAEAHGVVREPVERAVALRQREQQRHAGQRQKQLARKAGHHRVDRHAADVDADDPRQRDASTPTLSAVTQLTITASASAATEMTARFTCHRPVKRARRFARNAATPSRKSSLP